MTLAGGWGWMWLAPGEGQSVSLDRQVMVLSIVVDEIRLGKCRMQNEFGMWGSRGWSVCTLVLRLCEAIPKHPFSTRYSVQSRGIFVGC